MPTAILLLLLTCVSGFNVHEHKYEPNQEVGLYVNKIGPYRNPQEIYQYYHMPWVCKPDRIVASPSEGLGEALLGYELVKAPFQILFQENVPSTPECGPIPLDLETRANLKRSIRNSYFYQWFCDDLPVLGLVGDVSPGASAEERSEFVYTHKEFRISWNGPHVIHVNLTYNNKVYVTDDLKSLSYTYSVEWSETDVSFEDRFDKYLDDELFGHTVHFFSIFNSFMMVIFLMGLVSTILMRALKRDYARYAKELDEGDVGEDSGWKQVHGDVFRSPPRLELLSALLGTGHQLLLLGMLVLWLAALGTYYEQRGRLLTAFVVLYAMTSFFSGYFGGGFYARYKGKNWKMTAVLTSGLFPTVVFGTIFFLDQIAEYEGSLSYIPLTTMAVVVLIWGLLSVPLVIIGSVFGRHWNGSESFPTRVLQVPRQIPEKLWWQEREILVLLGGLLPFGSIFIEMYFVFMSFWHYKYYYVYGFFFLVFAILIVVCVCTTISIIYMHLNAEDWRWHWTAFFSGASVGLYMFLYITYYFFVWTNMSGFLQTAFYFGYMFIFCSGLGILGGSIGYTGASMFVKKIYENVKID